ncbi:MAG: hypothetical protein AUH92_04680 [Acidobacteria bacterium 13_1_40CM_4_69_4]|nr:MAG: hypothetical protein AUH92_04680 [Acidobacteria bacterium 13_1_40CM_4_69_4]
MNRALYRTGVAVLAVVVIATPAMAKKQTRSPEQGTWKVKVTPDAEAAAKGEKQTEDTLMIQQGIFRSTAWDPFGFPPVPYTLQGTTFTADPVSRQAGRIHWSGIVSGDTVAGRMVWTKKDGSVFSYTFSGARAPQQKAKKQK